MAGLKVTNLTKTYPSGETALYNANFETKDKEFLVIVGGEASGKSTLLRLIAGLEEVSSGTVEIGGKDITDVHPKDRNVAMVFRNDNLNSDATVYDNLAFGLRQRKAPPALIDQRVKIVAGVLGLSDVLGRKPKALSSAVRQCISLGRAMAREPQLYLFDEPLAGIDEKLRTETLRLIINMQARVQGTFIYATKNLSEAMTIGTRIVVLKNGLVQQIDTPANLYDYPANAYVAFYIGSPTVNFINDAKIVKDENGVRAEFKGGSFVLPENIVKRFKNVDGYVASGDAVMLGIRPEDCEIDNGGDLSGTVTSVQTDGDRTYAEVQTASGISMIVRGQSSTAKDAGCKIKVDLSRLLIFDGATRLTVLGRDEGYRPTNFADADFVPMPFEEENAAISNLKPKAKQNKKK